MSARSMLLIAPTQAAQVLVGIGSVVVFTRLMSPEDFGHYSLILTASIMAHTAALTWAEAAAFRFLPDAERRGEIDKHFGFMFGIALGAGVVCAVLLALCLALTPLYGWNAAAVGFAGALSVFRFLTKVARETDRAELRMGRYAIRETAFLVGGFGLGVGLLMWTPAGPAALFLGALLAGVVIAILDWPELWRRRANAAFDADRVRPYLSFGMPLAIGLAVEMAMQTTTRGVLTALDGPAATGVFAAAAGAVGRSLDVLFIWTSLAFAPPLLRAFEGGDRALIEKSSADLARALIAVATPAAVGVWLVAIPLCDILVGPAMARDAANLAPFIAIMALCNGLGVYLATEAFVLSRKTLVRAGLLIPVAVVHFALLVWLVPLLGVVGAGWASVLSAALGLALLGIVGARLAPLRLPLGDIAKVALSCLVMAGVTMHLPASGGWGELLSKASVGALVYGACLVALDVGGLRTWARERLLRTPT